uniref:Bromo domain-containing protein n=1 Tax=Timema monikensis TaxID=170555 RepID=A0A7R9E9S9_9NEOP|nr:unnamed protein product [Timema monikensis]
MVKTRRGEVNQHIKPNMPVKDSCSVKGEIASVEDNRRRRPVKEDSFTPQSVWGRELRNRFVFSSNERSRSSGDNTLRSRYSEQDTGEGLRRRNIRSCRMPVSMDERGRVYEEDEMMEESDDLGMFDDGDDENDDIFSPIKRRERVCPRSRRRVRSSGRDARTHSHPARAMEREDGELDEEMEEAVDCRRTFKQEVIELHMNGHDSSAEKPEGDGVRRSTRQRKLLYDNFNTSWILGTQTLRGYPMFMTNKDVSGGVVHKKDLAGACEPVEQDSKENLKKRHHLDELDPPAVPVDNSFEDMYSRVKRPRRPRILFSAQQSKARPRKLMDGTYDEASGSSSDSSSEDGAVDSREDGVRRQKYHLRKTKPIVNRFQANVDPPRRSNRILRSVLCNSIRRHRLHNVRKMSSSSSTSDDEHFDRKKGNKNRNRCMPINFTSADLPSSSHTRSGDRKQMATTLADVDPMELDRNILFKHVGGLESHIQCLKEMVVFPILYREVFEKFHINPPKGVLFHGPPGTGKTLIARALANECSKGDRRVSFFMRKGADCLSKWVGESERQLRLLFDQERHEILRIHVDQWDEPPSPLLLSQLAEQAVGYCGSDLRALCTEAVIQALKRRYPQIYDSNQRLLLDPKAVKVEQMDFGRAKCNIVPSSHRASHTPARKLSDMVEPLIKNSLNSLVFILAESFPCGVSSSPCSKVGNFISRPVQHARLLLSGYTAAQGQSSYLGPALLHHMEHVAVHRLDLATLYEVSGRTPEEACIQVFHEVCRNLPAIIYVPKISQWWQLAPESVHAIFLAQLQNLDPGLPILLLGTSDVPYNTLPSQVCSLFSEYRGEVFMLQDPQASEREAFFFPLLNIEATRPPKMIRKKSKAPLSMFVINDLLSSTHGPFESGKERSASYRGEPGRKVLRVTAVNRAGRFGKLLRIFAPLYFAMVLEPMEALPIAPPPEPPKLSEQELRDLYEKEEDSLSELRIFLRQICAKLARNRQFFMFTKPVDINEVPDYLSIVNEPMDLETMMTKIDLHRYSSAKEFLDDVDLLCRNALAYNPDKDPADKLIRHRACSLRDTAYTLIKAEMNSDFEEKCQEISRKIAVPQTDSPSKDPAMLPSKERGTHSLPQATINGTLSGVKKSGWKYNGEPCRTKKRKSSFWARGELGCRKKKVTPRRVVSISPENNSLSTISPKENGLETDALIETDKNAYITQNGFKTSPEVEDPLKIHSGYVNGKHLNVTNIPGSRKTRSGVLKEEPDQVLDIPTNDLEGRLKSSLSDYGGDSNVDEVDLKLGETSQGNYEVVNHCNRGGEIQTEVRQSVEVDRSELKHLLTQAVKITKKCPVEMLVELYVQLSKVVAKYSNKWNRTTLPQDLEKEMLRFQQYSNANRSTANQYDL